MVKINNVDKSMYESYNTDGQNNVSQASALEWQKTLLAALSQTNNDSGSSESEGGDFSSGLSMSGMSKMKIKMPPPPPEPINQLEALADKAEAQGVLTTEEAAEFKELLEERQTKSGMLDPAIMKILQAYLPVPGSEENTSSTDTTTTTTTATIAVSSVSDTELTPEEREAERLAALKNALAAAQEAGDLTDEQVAEIEAFISSEETFTSLMAKIEAAGITLDETVAESSATSTEEDNPLKALIAKAQAAGALTEEEVAELEEILEKQRTTGFISPQTMQVLLAYIQPSEEEDSEDSQTVSSIDELKAERDARRKQRLEDLKAALAAAQEAGELTDEQVAAVEEFISNEESFSTLMAKIESSGLQLDQSVA